MPSGTSSKDGVVLRPSFDPELKPVLDAILVGFPASLDIESIQWMRKNTPAPNAKPILDKYPDLDHTEYTVPGLNDGDEKVILSVFRPKTAKSSSLPACYYIHGGGQVFPDRFSQLENMITWLEGIEIIFVSVEFRLAPEHPAPAGLHDTYAGYLWLVENAASLGVDKSKIIVGGGSGGAPFAVSVALLCRDDNKTPPCGVMVISPMLDDRGTTVSTQQFEADTMWNGRINRQAWQHILGDRQGQPDVDPLLAPGRVEDLTGFPPTFVDVGTCEVFRDEAVAFATRLWKYGVSAELHVWPGAFHGYDVFAPGTAISRESISAKNKWAKRTLSALNAKEKADA